MAVNENLFSSDTSSAATSSAAAGLASVAANGTGLDFTLDSGATVTLDPVELEDDLVSEALTITADNTVSSLSQSPIGDVDFHVNGALVTSGITHSGTAVTIDSAVLGYNVSPGVDVVTATYVT